MPTSIKLARALFSVNVLPENLSGHCFHGSTFFLSNPSLSQKLRLGDFEQQEQEQEQDEPYQN